MLNGKDMTILLTVGLVKKFDLNDSQYFPPYVSKKNNIKVVLDLSGYAREDNLNNFRRKDYIEQNYLVFEPKYKYFKTSVDAAGTNVLFWGSKGLSNETITSTVEPEYDTSPKLEHSGENLYLKFSGDRLKQNKVVYNHGSVVNMYFVYSILSSSYETTDTLGDCLFGAVSVKKNYLFIYLLISVF